MVPSIPVARARQGLRFFILLSLLTFAVLFYLTGTRDTLRALDDFRISYFFIALFLVGCDFCLGGARIYIFTRKISRLPERCAFTVSLKANLATLFMAAATPFATGGGLAQLYILHRAGVAVPAATAAGILNFVGTILFILVSGPIALGWLRSRYTGIGIHYVLSFSTVVFYVVTVLFLLCLFKPAWIASALTAGLRGLGRIRPKKRQTFERWSDAIRDFISTYRSCTSTFWKKEKPTLLLNFLLTSLLFGNKCLIAYVILRGMGLHPDFLHVFALQLLLLFIVYFSPTPGASGLAEAGTSVLMAGVLPEHMLPVFALLWRFFLTYFGVIIGGIILMRAIGVKKGGVEKKIRED